MKRPAAVVSKAAKKPHLENGVSSSAFESAETRHKFNIGGDKYVVISVFGELLRVHIRAYKENETGQLIATKSGVTLTPAVWYALLKEMDSISFSSSSSSPLIVGDSLVISSVDIENDFYIILQRYFVRKDFSRCFLPDVCKLTEAEWSKLKAVSKEITTSLISVSFKTLLPKLILRESRRQAPAEVSDIDSIDAEIALTTSLIELLTVHLKERIDDTLECYGCIQQYANQLGHECLTLNRNEKLARLEDRALVTLDIERLAKDFFQEMINRDEVLRGLLQYWPVTVFAPTNDAIERNNEWVVGRENKVVSYHVLSLVAEKDMFPFKAATSLAGSPPLYLNYREGPGFWKEYFVNNAKITRSEEFVSQEGSKQLLYVIDEILQPFVSSRSLGPTAFDLLEKPDLYDIREPLSAFSTRVKQEDLKEIFQREGNHTFFLPVGAGMGHSFNRQQEVDKWVIRGHVIPKHVLFTRLVTVDSYPSEAYADDIKVELSIINESNAMGNSYVLYAQSNTVHSNYRHKKGVVMAKILKPNIPVENGVVHLIESPLMIVDITVWKFLQNEREGRLQEFLDFVHYAPNFKDILKSSQEKTLFAPSNEAIRQLPKEVREEIKANTSAVTNLLRLHLVTQSISSDDVIHGRHKEYISADNRNSLYFRILGEEKNRTLTVDGGGVKAAAIQADIGAVDGMIHIIDRLLGMPYQTMFLKLQTDPDMSITYQMCEQDDWCALLDGSDKRFTFFVPANEAWYHLKHEMPTEFKQLTMGVFPYHVHKILDRHLVVNRELRASDLERTKEIQMVHSHFKVKHGHYPNEKSNLSGGLPPLAELLLEWDGIEARIIRPDVQAVNGVIHVIDRVMMKRRDLTKSGSPIGSKSTGFLPTLLVFILVAILF